MRWLSYLYWLLIRWIIIIIVVVIARLPKLLSQTNGPIEWKEYAKFSLFQKKLSCFAGNYFNSISHVSCPPCLNASCIFSIEKWIFENYFMSMSDRLHDLKYDEMTPIAYQPTHHTPHSHWQLAISWMVCKMNWMKSKQISHVKNKNNIFRLFVRFIHSKIRCLHTHIFIFNRFLHFLSVFFISHPIRINNWIHFTK